MKISKMKLNLLGLLICLVVFVLQNVLAIQKGDGMKGDSVQMAYPFELKDKDGKLVRMEDFKGKVVVLDFWFTRCIPCMVLAKPLAEIREYYRDNPNVIFIDVNLDSSVSEWKNSLVYGSKLGKHETFFYTDSLSISVSTAPLGFSNNITKYYGMTGVPTWIIIGAKGEILERKPPRPLPKQDGIESVGSLRFKALINQYLLSYLKQSRAQ